MPYDKRLHDGSDPLYAPGMSKTKDRFYWRAPRRYTALVKKKRAELPGREGDGLDLERARLCRELTREMMKEANAEGPGLNPGTWAWLIARYQTDEFSPYRQVGGNAKKSYDWLCKKWLGVIGHMQIGSIDYEQIKRLERAMIDKQSLAYAHRMFTMLRTIAKYGRVLRIPSARDVSEVLTDVRFSKAPRRQVAVTREELRAIVDEADARGLFSFSTGLLIQWTFALRAVDVRGQWFPTDGKGGLVRNGKRWQDGLEWSMVSPDLRSFTKVISKTKKSMPEPQEFRLTWAPEVQARLRLLANHRQVGPVILSNRFGLPYNKGSWTRMFADLRDACGLRKEITAMDVRAGALTEAKDLGATPWELRDAGQHSNITTTSGYARDRSAGIEKVVKLRSGQ